MSTQAHVTEAAQLVGYTFTTSLHLEGMGNDFCMRPLRICWPVYQKNVIFSQLQEVVTADVDGESVAYEKYISIVQTNSRRRFRRPKPLPMQRKQVEDGLDLTTTVDAQPTTVQKRRRDDSEAGGDRMEPPRTKSGRRVPKGCTTTTRSGNAAGSDTPTIPREVMRWACSLRNR
ncbi:hypothetical protein BAUCODRAFT_145506 [Baudoinia panamericana UAMH 10762]|uniref:Uncharacterized protein n=1 Tax=Baudoinia panamericana (strain UAMH 10762) TaxID=717646 RepID=M2MTH2_BAUPA|nr:uncharacterized protein BAUCODRAFT_145506 [Baudoinia panamericana UAMH 10762]EMD00202.1 hypothetical protein BAUCODRAFT_145506 [Baudoinia panamericana UAMH 10762]